MKKTIAFFSLLAGLAALPGIASATGGLGCGIDDKNAKLEFESLFSYSDIGGLFQIRGEMQVKDERVGKTLQKFTLEETDLKQQWFRDNDVKLMLYREAEGDGVPFASVKLIIEATKPPEEDFGYAGKYWLTIAPVADAGESQSVTFEGKVGCSAG
jgi:hypothetical protein